LQGYSVEEVKERSIVLDDTHEEFGREIEFDYMVLATVSFLFSLFRLPGRALTPREPILKGSRYPFPCRPEERGTEESIKEQFRKLQGEIAEASSVLICGGGPVGMELTGEIAEYYNTNSSRQKKKITLIHSGKRFLAGEGWKPKFGDNLKNQLEKLGVELKFDEKVEVGDRETGPLRGGDREFRLKNGETIQGEFSRISSHSGLG